MKIIKIDKIEIIYNDLDHYAIKTPLGTFRTVDDALKVFPELAEHKNIAKCSYCGKHFIKVGKANNNRKYCSDKCSEAYNKINKKELDRMWQRDKLLRNTYKTKMKDKYNFYENTEYNQDDTFWGVGSSHLHEHAKKDFKHEQYLVKKELKRLKL